MSSTDLKFNKNARMGSNAPCWKGGRHLSSTGYVLIYSPEHPRSTKAGYVTEHALVMEKHIGRYLTEDNIIHHINEIRSDNRIENLQLTDRRNHMRIHHTMDMSNRKCSQCGSNRTRIEKYNNRPHWKRSRITCNLLCAKCYDKETWHQI